MVVQIFLYQKRKLKNLDEKLLYGMEKFVLQEKLMGKQLGDLVELMNT